MFKFTKNVDRYLLVGIFREDYIQLLSIVREKLLKEN